MFDLEAATAALQKIYQNEGSNHYQSQSQNINQSENHRNGFGGYGGRIFSDEFLNSEKYARQQKRARKKRDQEFQRLDAEKEYLKQSGLSETEALTEQLRRKGWKNPEKAIATAAENRERSRQAYQGNDYPYYNVY